jgi:hypothetical protein
MLSEVPEGLLMFFDSNRARVGDAAFQVLDLYLDLAPCSGDIPQHGVLWNGRLLPLCPSFEAARLVTNVQTAAVSTGIHNYRALPIQSGGVPERGKVIGMAALSETRTVFVRPF